MEIKLNTEIERAMSDAINIAEHSHHEYLTPEHLLLSMLRTTSLSQSMEPYGNVKQLEKELRTYVRNLEKVENEEDLLPDFSAQMHSVILYVTHVCEEDGIQHINIPLVLRGILRLEDSWAAYLLKKTLGKNLDALLWEMEMMTPEEQEETDDDFDQKDGEQRQEEEWLKYVTCLNDIVDRHNPLIGRERELERTIQVLCRKDKNNPLHVGDAGVGKTALVYGLAARINSGDVPERLRDSKIFMMDMGTMVAGTQYRGDFEKRLKDVMEGASKFSAPIIYIDEIHNIVGAGKIEGSLDASNILKPYMEKGDIRFIGSTTYEEFNKYFSKSQGIMRRFQQIDIDEPSTEETVKIIRGLLPRYEVFHNVTYTDEAVEYAVTASAKYINDRFLPDKAIDVIDESGAYRELHPEKGRRKKQTVSKALVAEIIAKMCKVDTMAVQNNDDNDRMATLRERIESQIYGQQEAVTQVVEAVQMARAGLLDDNKPLASLLFVGPTGVGKTEVSRVLAKEMGIELVRFDMSEYTEKHTVAKLIGSPAGYVGYEDGGLLTDAIRKSPNCVLLLDEIEKAHPDIYNILLQVMDYARLTDNRGRKADFRNVVVIMTSNAGAQYAAQAAIGFGGGITAGQAMLKQVKKTFKPEFINRLSGIVVFNEMDRHMAELILDKKLRQLQEKLTARGVTMTLSSAARDLLLQQGFTRDHGAREMDRVIATTLKPLLSREILYGKLQKGGNVTVDVKEGVILLSVEG